MRGQCGHTAFRPKAWSRIWTIKPSWSVWRWTGPTMPASRWPEISPSDSGRGLSALPPRTSGRQCILPKATTRRSFSMRRLPPIESAVVGTRSRVSRFGREAREVRGVAFRPDVAGALRAAAGESRRYPRGRCARGDHRGSLRGSRPERSGDAGGPAAHRRAACGPMAGSEKRSGGLEGCAGGPQGRVRRVADSGCRKGSHDRGNSRAGRVVARMRCRMLRTWRRGCAATASWRTPSFPKRPAA